MKLFLDTGVLVAAASSEDRWHREAGEVIAGGEQLVTTTAVLAELWALVRRRHTGELADRVVRSVVGGRVAIESVGIGDLRRALEIGEEFPDQGFSLVDRLSFAVMHRLGVTRVATFDHHFSVYRFGPGRRRAFEIVR